MRRNSPDLKRVHGAAAKKGYPDILHASLVADVNSTEWISDSIIRGRRIRLRGIGVHAIQEGGKLSLSPVLPHVAKALALLKRHPRCNDLTWTGIEWKRTQVKS